MANKIERRVWIWDKDNRNISPLLNQRYHAEGWCVAVTPYGTTGGATTSYDGDPNDFTCAYCGNDYRRLAVSEEQAHKLMGITQDAKNGLDNLNDFPTSTATSGCYCITGYEHQKRQCVPAPASGRVPGSTLVPMVCKTVDMTPEDEGGAVEEVTVEAQTIEAPDDQEHAVTVEPSDSSPSEFQNPFA